MSPSTTAFTAQARPGFRAAAMVAAPVASGVAITLLLSRAVPGGVRTPLAIVVLLVLIAVVAAGVVMRTERPGERITTLALLAMAAAATTMAASSLVAMSGYVRIPADILAFSENMFLGDIIKLQQGVPLFTPGPDNNSYPYMPAAQLLTHGLASLFQDRPSIPLLRIVQLGYVVTAALVAAWIVRLLVAAQGAQGARGTGGTRGAPGRGDGRAAAWFVTAFGFLLLVALDPNFNLYNHALHNDGLGLLLTVATFAVLARHLWRPSAATLLVLAVLPALGFAVKQSLLIWAPLAGVAIWVVNPREWRRVLAMWVATGILVASIVAYGYARWGGADFTFWVFRALGERHVSPARAVEHFLSAGVYVAMLIATAVALARRARSREVLVLYAVSVVLLLVESYTSAIGFVRNHLGPGVMLATCWFLATLQSRWPVSLSGGRRQAMELAALAAGVIVLFPGLGLLRQPRDPVPADVSRYIAELEAEFAGADPSRVLLDVGSWIYYRHGIVMRDRAYPISEHLAFNQREIDTTMIAATVERFASQLYDRILVRDFDGQNSTYDYGRPNGMVRTALARHYEVVRRIRGVDVSEWWPRRLVADVFVLERRRDGGVNRPPRESPPGAPAGPARVPLPARPR